MWASLGNEESEEELRGMIELHEGPDADAEQERQMLRSILDLGDVWVEDVMTHRSDVVMLDADQPVGMLIQAVIESPYTRLPLWRENQDEIVGVLHAKSLLRALRDKSDAEIAELSIDDLTQSTMVRAGNHEFARPIASLSRPARAFRGGDR